MSRWILSQQVPTRTACAVLYSTSRLPGAFCFCGWPRPPLTTKIRMMLLRNWSASRAARKYAVNEMSLLNDRNPIHQNKLDSLRVLQWRFVSRFVNDSVGIENRDVRVGPHANPSFVLEHRYPFLEALCGH